MRNHTTQRLLFTSLPEKKVEGDFMGGEISSDAGALLLREVDLRIRLVDDLANAITDRRDPRYVKQRLPDLLMQRISQISCGYEDADDCDELRRDPVFKMLSGRNPVTDHALGSQPTMSRFENAVKKSDLLRMGRVLLQKFIDSYASPPRLIVLDFDTTDDTTHGEQQLSLFNAFYDEYCYLPIHVYEGLTGKLVTTVLRPGKTLTDCEIITILKRIIPALRAAWPDTLIVFRADSHFAKPRVLDWLEANKLLYAIALAKNNVLFELCELTRAEARGRFETFQHKSRVYGSFYYAAKSWSRCRRVIVRAEYSFLGENPRFLLTNMERAKAKVLYEDIYSPRGRTEQFIEDHKRHLRSDRTSCHSFAANQFRLFLHSAAYVLLHTFREEILRGTEFASAKFDTIRLRLLKIGGQVRELKTKVRVHLPSSFPLKGILRKACALFSYIPPLRGP